MVDQNKAVANYTAAGRYQVTLDTFFVDTTNTIRVDTTITNGSSGGNTGRGGTHGNNIDPLAQTFSFLQDSIITKFGVFFGTKDPVLPVTLQLRDVVNGYPGPTVLGTCTLQPSQVFTSNGDVETIFTFRDPVLCNRDIQYCFVIMTDSAQYRLWIAKMGEKDTISSAYVPAQPFLGGTLFSSNDNRAWTAHQEMDAKFKIYIAKFDANDAILNFNKITDIEASQIIVAVNQIVQPGTAVSWEISKDTLSWSQIDINNGVNQLDSKYTDIYLRAVLSGLNNSPLINTGAIVATGIKFELTGQYINRNIVTLSPFSTVCIWADVDTPSSTSVVIQYSVDDGATWNNATLNSNTALSETVSQRYYKNILGTNSSQLRVRINFTGTEVNYATVGRLMVTMV